MRTIELILLGIAKGADILEDSGSQIALADGVENSETTSDYLMKGIFWSKMCTKMIYNTFEVDIPVLHLVDDAGTRPSNGYYTVAIDMQ